MVRRLFIVISMALAHVLWASAQVPARASGSAGADSDYSHLTFKADNGTEVTVSVEALVMTFSDGQLIATNGEGTQAFSLKDLTTMRFELRGDVNGDGALDDNDVDMLSDVVMGNEEKNNRCDVNADNVINVADIVALVDLVKTIIHGRYP